jgi:hypothetical protein
MRPAGYNLGLVRVVVKHSPEPIKVLLAKSTADGFSQAIGYTVRMANSLAFYQLYLLLLYRLLIKAFNLDVSLHDPSSNANPINVIF